MGTAHIWQKHYNLSATELSPLNWMEIFLIPNSHDSDILRNYQKLYTEQGWRCLAWRPSPGTLQWVNMRKQCHCNRTTWPSGGRKRNLARDTATENGWAFVCDHAQYYIKEATILSQYWWRGDSAKQACGETLVPSDFDWLMNVPGISTAMAVRLYAVMEKTQLEVNLMLQLTLYLHHWEKAVWHGRQAIVYKTWWQRLLYPRVCSGLSILYAGFSQRYFPDHHHQHHQILTRKTGPWVPSRPLEPDTLRQA